MVALAAPEPNAPRRILSLGEATWGETIGHHHHCLTRARDLLTLKGYDTTHTALTLYGAAGFTPDPRILLVDLPRLYS
ncbi:hypothetical protein [Catenuloplanes japonicus]|uniref:hypothetical protein n=1 Tax=Catenuloplanes japonicus TaxID=33876 RepID=UPI000526CE6E|nr:hypothetical protein [Catenuloplanes japonicus]